MSQKKEWREFEQLVALIEAEAAPRGAMVKSPDRIRDMITGRLREVDVSIRFKAGTVDVLITIECRNRTRIADDVWIEQLATKRQRIGAAKTIAVSAKGFSQSANLSAKHYGIELRELSNIKSEDVGDWFLPHGIVHLFRLIEEVQCTIRHRGSEIVETVDAERPLFRHKLVNGVFQAYFFMNFIEMKEPKRFWAIPLDGTKTRLTFDLDATASDLIPVPLGVVSPSDASLKIVLENGEFEVLSLQLSVLVSYKSAVFDRDQGEHHVYRSPEGGVIQHSTFTGEVFGLPVRFDHQGNVDETSSSVQFPSGVRLPSKWVGIKKKDKDA